MSSQDASQSKAPTQSTSNRGQDHNRRLNKERFRLSPIAIQSMLSGDDSIDPVRSGTYSITVRVSMPTAATTTAPTSRTASTAPRGSALQQQERLSLLFANVANRQYRLSRQLLLETILL